MIAYACEYTWADSASRHDAEVEARQERCRAWGNSLADELDALDPQHRRDVFADLIDAVRAGQIHEARRIIDSATTYVCAQIEEAKV